MDVAALSQLIGSIGFPIVACIACFYRMGQESDSHRQEMDKMTEALNNNTLVLTKLTQKLDDMDREGDV